MSRYLTLSSQGMRYAKLTAYDKAGNKTVVYIYANIDRTAPNVPTITGYKKTNTADAGSIYKTLSNYSFNSSGVGEWYNKYVYTRASGSSDSISGFEGYYCTTIGQSEDATGYPNNRQTGRNVNMEGEVTVKFKACDKAVNCSDDKVVKTRLDRTAPNRPTLDMTRSYNKNKSNGYKATVYSNNTWINKNIYMTDARTVLSDGKFQGPKATDVTPRSGVVISGVSKYQISSNNTQWEDHSYNSDRELYQITKEGVSKRYIRTVDKAGNSSAATTFTVKLDKTDPTCTRSKSNTYSTSGVIVSVYCKDQSNLSGCDYNYDTYYGLGSGTYYYSVSDEAGNTDKCSGVTVYSQLQKSTRSWDYCQSKTYSCSIGSPGPVSGYCSFSASYGTQKQCLNGCPQASGCGKLIGGGWACNVIVPQNEHCQGGWSSWSSWYDTGSCYNSDSSQCRTLYY